MANRRSWLLRRKWRSRSKVFFGGRLSYGFLEGGFEILKRLLVEFKNDPFFNVVLIWLLDRRLFS